MKLDFKLLIRERGTEDARMISVRKYLFGVRAEEDSGEGLSAKC